MQPLPDDVAELLTKDRAAALGASFVIGARHPDILLWAARMIGADWSQSKPTAAPKRNGARFNGYLADRRAQRDRDDLALVEAMKSDPDGTIGAWSQAIRKSKGSVASALRRLEEAGAVERDNGRWRAASPKEPPPKWTKPLSGSERAHQVHLTA